MSKRNKQKSKQRSKGQHSSGSPSGWFRPRQPDFAQIAIQATALIEADKPDEALELLEPRLSDFPRAVELLSVAAIAYIQVGDLWAAIDCFERSYKVYPDPFVLAPLAELYRQAGLGAYARQAAHRAIKEVDDPEFQLPLQAMVTMLDQEFASVVQSTGIPLKDVETGLRYHDDAQRAGGQRNDFQAAIDANRRAIRFLKNWPPVHNNLAQALFYNGQPAEAISTVESVLAREPNNLHALSNAIKFLAWSGKTMEARALWDRLRHVEAEKESDRYKQAEAAAILEEDESVYQILKPVVDAGEETDLMLYAQAIYRLAVAEANRGRTQSALKRLKELDQSDPRVQDLIEALKAKRPGTGWSTRYAYFSVPELMPMSNFEKVALLMDQRQKLDEPQFRKRVDKLVAQYPQLLLIGRKLIWDAQQPQLGLDLLDMLGTPEAYAMIREFGLSQVGSDQERFDALIGLKEAGVLKADEPVRMWSEGEWREIKLISYEINDEPEITYAPTVVKLYERALEAYQRHDFVEAERLLKQVVALEPRAADAYYNLGTTYIMQDKVEQGKAMYRKSMEVRPLYAMPRCQLANFLLDDKDVEGAKALLLPLADVTRLSTVEANLYMYIQARILVFEEEYEKARAMLEALLKISPDFDPAQNLLERISLLATLGKGFKGFLENMRRRQAKRRTVMHTKLNTVDVTVDMALSLFNREVQGTMARYILAGERAYALKKKELHARLVQMLPERDTLERLVAEISTEERAALRAVVTHGGTMAWDEFDKQYGNDLDENPDWQYHEPTTLMGRLRQRALLATATVNNQSLVIIPLELRKPLAELL